MALSDEILADLKAKKGGGGEKAPPPMAAKDPTAAKEGGEESYGSDEEAAGAEVMAAKDPAAWTEAMRAFLEICVPKIVDSAKGGPIE